MYVCAKLKEVRSTEQRDPNLVALSGSAADTETKALLYDRKHRSRVPLRFTHYSNSAQSFTLIY